MRTYLYDDNNSIYGVFYGKYPATCCCYSPNVPFFYFVYQIYTNQQKEINRT